MHRLVDSHGPGVCRAWRRLPGRTIHHRPTRVVCRRPPRLRSSIVSPGWNITPRLRFISLALDRVLYSFGQVTCSSLLHLVDPLAAHYESDGEQPAWCVAKWAAFLLLIVCLPSAHRSSTQSTD
jgi:hypothetical protein